MIVERSVYESNQTRFFRNFRGTSTQPISIDRSSMKWGEVNHYIPRVSCLSVFLVLSLKRLVTKKLDFRASPATLYAAPVDRNFVPALWITTMLSIDSIRFAIRYHSVARTTLYRRWRSSRSRDYRAEKKYPLRFSFTLTSWLIRHFAIFRSLLPLPFLSASLWHLHETHGTPSSWPDILS